MPDDYVSQQSSKVKFLQDQIKSSDESYNELICKIKQFGPTGESNPIQMGAYDPSQTFKTTYGQSFGTEKKQQSSSSLLYPVIGAGMIGTAATASSTLGATGASAGLSAYPSLNTNTNLFSRNPITAQATQSMINTSSNFYPTLQSSQFQSQNAFNATGYPSMTNSFQQQQMPNQQQSLYQLPQQQNYGQQNLQYPQVQAYNAYQPLQPQPQIQRPQSAYPSTSSFRQSYQQPQQQQQYQQYQQPITMPPSSQLVPSDLKNLNGQGQLRTVFCPREVVERFIEIANANTFKKLETCAILAGNEKNNALIIDTIIIPKQEGHQDHCFMTDEIGLFEAQINNNVMTIGWIHTHPQYDLFLSSVDLHNQLGYQIQMPEAIAIVCSPVDKTDRYKAFRIKDRCMNEISKCQRTGFHEHKGDNGRPGWEQCSHHQYISGAQHNISVKVIDLRV